MTKFSMFEMMQLAIPVDIFDSFDFILDFNLFSVVIGASEHTCQSVEDVVGLLKKGSTVRHTGATQMNDESSRSHAIFTLYIGRHHIA